MGGKILTAALCLYATIGGCVTGERPGAIREGDLERHVGFLAADSMGGRDTGSEGIARAEAYVAEQFAEYGLRPLPGADDFRRPFDLYRLGYDASATWLEFEGERTVLGETARPFPFSDDGTLEAEVVFAGYGITAPEHDWDDYLGLDVEGRWVLVLRHEPHEDDPASPFDGEASSSHATFAAKAANAQSHGARGMILVTDPLHHAEADDLRAAGRLRLEPPESDEAADSDDVFLALHVSRSIAERLVADSGRSLADLQRAVDGGATPASLAVPSPTARGSVQALDRAEKVVAHNVVAFLEGSDPELRDEWVLVGGHHDHIGAYGSGAGDVDTIFNGADDNASGVAGVLELAQAFASGERPRRSLVFATFSAEERGLLGSRALVADEEFPIERVAFMFNLDMIGRNPERGVDVVGDGFVRGLREIVEAANADVGLPLSFSGTDYAGNSDHDSFYRRDIPFMFFFAGLHEDYHGLGDHADKLAYPRMASLLRVARGVIERLADGDGSPTFIHHIGWLGLAVEVVDGQAQVTAVDPGSRAEQFGLAVGDVVTGFGEEPLDDPEQVGEGFRAIDPGSEATLAVDRGGRAQTVAVSRARTGYMGVFPGAVDEDLRRELKLPETEGVLMRQVVPDGPCAQAGLVEGDIVLRVDGQPMNTGNLRGMMSQIGAGETVDFLVLRDGERLTLPVTLGERPQR